MNSPRIPARQHPLALLGLLWLAAGLPQHVPGVTIDPRFNAGRMTFVRNRVPVFAVLGSLAGGDSVDEVMQQYGLTLQEVAAVDEHREWAATAA